MKNAIKLSVTSFVLSFITLATEEVKDIDSTVNNKTLNKVTQSTQELKIIPIAKNTLLIDDIFLKNWKFSQMISLPKYFVSKETMETLIRDPKRETLLEFILNSIAKLTCEK